MRRPLGITVSTILMYIAAFAGLFALNLHEPHPAITIALAIFLLLIASAVLYHFWRGRNWARWLVLLDCLIQFLNLWSDHRWRSAHPQIALSPIRSPLLLSKAALAVALLVYLNTPSVRAWFTDRSRDAQDTPEPHSPPAASAVAPHTEP